MNTAWKACLAAGLWAVLAGTALAQDDGLSRPPSSAMGPTQLTGTLAKLRTSGKIVIAHRESSVPFSYLNARNEPIGYSIELCKALVNSIADAVNKTLTITWVPVTSASRFDAITSGQADLECGSTTSNLERQKLVAFSPIFFVSGTKLMVKTGSPVRSFRDLGGKKVVVTAGTTNEKTLRDLLQKFKLDTQITVMPDHAASFAQVASGAADAFATDDVLLYGLAAGRPDPKALKVVGRFMTTEPLAIMLPENDPEFKKLVDDEMRRLITSREIYPIYDKWFNKPIPPNNTVLNLPVSYLLRDFWKYPTDQVPF